MIGEETQQLLSVAANVVTTLGIIFGAVGLFIAISTYRSERVKERLEREYGTFDDLDDKYVEFMYKCTEYPDLDLFSIPADKNRVISENDRKVERALFAVLISIFERAFLIFERHADETSKERQYPGWIECMKSYCLRDSFLNEWRDIGDQFDSGFQQEMNTLIEAELKAVNEASVEKTDG